MPSALYLASTPLHILNAIALASSQDSHDAYLVLIDQPNIQNNPYYKILNHWDKSPFKNVEIFPGRIKGLRNKLQSRKKVFRALDVIVSDLKPSQIYTGNDRRIEFQYAMHAAKRVNKNHPCLGIYMDEGTFTYVGRKDSSSISDRYVDNFIKKLTYGFWWRNPITIGGSPWIHRIYAAFPEKVHSLLRSKDVIALKPCYDSNNTLQSFCSELLSFFSATPESIGQLDAILTLPHESIIDSISGYRDSMLKALNLLSTRGLKVGVKYHPRNSHPDILDAAKKPGIEVIPHQVPFEAILPLLNQCIIIGDISSTLINSRWLKPEAKIFSIANPQAPLFNEFIEFFAQIGVEAISVDQLEDQLQQVLHA